jgi:hypothetical protein
MTVLSGGLVYEWTQETSNYGLMQPNANGSANLLGDFDTLQSQFNKLNITLITTQNETATNLQPPRCSAGLISNDGFSTDFDIPAAPQGAAALISNGISDAPTGSIVPVTQTSVAVPVYATNGAKIENLVIKPAAGANEPGGASGFSTGGGSATATATASTSTKKECQHWRQIIGSLPVRRDSWLYLAQILDNSSIDETDLTITSTTN